MIMIIAIRKALFITISIFFCSLAFSNNSDLLLEPSSHCFFIPPKDWNPVDPKSLAQKVKIAFIGKTKKNFFPSINLATEEIDISMSEYLKIVKNLHETDRNNRWRELGNIKTQAGIARLTSIDMATEFGAVRMLQMFLMKNGTVYILTASALKEELSQYYSDIQNSFRSLTITPDLFAVIQEPQKKEHLLNLYEKLIHSFKEHSTNNNILNVESIFHTESFQKEHWIPFQDFILQEFQELGAHWQVLLLQQVQTDFLKLPISSER